MYLQSTWKRRPFGAKACAGERWQLAAPSSWDRASPSSRWPWPYRQHMPKEDDSNDPWSLSRRWCTGSSLPCCQRSSPSPPLGDPVTCGTCSPLILRALSSTSLSQWLLKPMYPSIYMCDTNRVLGFEWAGLCHVGLKKTLRTRFSFRSCFLLYFSPLYCGFLKYFKKNILESKFQNLF